jgi:hypothetical protein
MTFFKRLVVTILNVPVDNAPPVFGYVSLNNPLQPSNRPEKHEHL